MFRPHRIIIDTSNVHRPHFVVWNVSEQVNRPDGSTVLRSTGALRITAAASQPSQAAHEHAISWADELVDGHQTMAVFSPDWYVTDYV
jgi:hypothetical protein